MGRAALSVGCLGIWLLVNRRFALLAALALGLAVVGIVIHSTSLQGTIGARTGQHQKSNEIRSRLGSLTLTDALSSPVIGYGDTRKQRGSGRSIAIGPTKKCPQCGEQAVGSTGQLWLVLVTSGFLGAAFFVGFLGSAFGATDATGLHMDWRGCWCWSCRCSTRSPTRRYPRRLGSRCWRMHCSGAPTWRAGNDRSDPLCPDGAGRIHSSMPRPR